MDYRTIGRSVISACVAAGLLSQAGCKRAPEAETTAAAPPSPAWTLDESLLTPPVRFTAADLDPALDPCQDLSGYVNGKWLAANPIPGDKTTWGPWDVLELRSLGVRRQIAEHAAAQKDPTGIQKIVADFWV